MTSLSVVHCHAADRIADQYVDTGGGGDPDSSDFIPSGQNVESTSNRTTTIGDDVLLNDFSSDYDVSQETGVDPFNDHCFKKARLFHT